MPLPIIAVVAARLGIRLATYMVGKHLKKGAAKKLRKAITKKRAEIAKKKETSEKGFRGEGSKRKQEKVTQRKKPKVDSGLAVRPKTRLSIKEELKKQSIKKAKAAAEKQENIRLLNKLRDLQSLRKHDLMFKYPGISGATGTPGLAIVPKKKKELKKKNDK